MSRTQQKSWLGRSWRFFVAGLGLLVVFVALILWLVFGIMHSSDVYKEAVAKAQADPAVQEVLGSPVRTGLLVNGSINVSGSDGQADLAIPVSGPREKGTLHVSATKSAGHWTFSTLVLEVADTQQQVNLLK